MLYFIATRAGFVKNGTTCINNFRYAKPFTSFSEADDYARRYHGHRWFAILSNGDCGW